MFLGGGCLLGSSGTLQGGTQQYHPLPPQLHTHQDGGQAGSRERVSNWPLLPLQGEMLLWVLGWVKWALSDSSSGESRVVCKMAFCALQCVCLESKSFLWHVSNLS